MAPSRSKHPNLSTYHFMSCILLLASTTAMSAAASTYSSACPSPAPAADCHTDAGDALSLAGSFQLYNGHFSGGTEDGLFSLDDDPLHGSYRSFSLFPDRAARTSDPALVHLAATLELTGPRSRLNARGRNHTLGAFVSFVLDGYYSSASLELCMVGTPSATTTGLAADAVVVLRLRVPNPPRLADPFVTGTLEGSSDLGAIRLLAYVRGDDYEYGDSGRAATCSPPAAPPVQSLGVGGDLPACAHLVDQLVTSYRLVAQDDHHGGGAPAVLPRRMHVNQMHCTANGGVRAYVVFSADGESRGSDVFMVGEKAAVAEGHWDTAQGMLCLRACRVMRTVPPSTLAVGECGMRMSFWFPAVWTVRDRSVVAGMLWNTSTHRGNRITGDDAGPSLAGANVMSAFSIDDPADYHRRNLSDVRYEYNNTMLEEAIKHYLKIKKERKTIRGPFPVPGNHQDTYHDFSLRFLGRNATGSGDAYPVSIGYVMMSEDALAAAAADDDKVGTKHGLLSVSYDIHHYAPPEHRARPPKNASYSRRPPLGLRQRISAEGVYDPERGILCLAGCREHNGSTDCRVLITLQLASLDGSSSMEQGHGGAGVISSLRDRADRLFFEKMDIAMYGMYSVQLSDAVSRMDLESVLLVASATLSCVFAAAQILHAKRNPEAAPATSVTMLAILAMGHLAPLALGFETLFMSRRSRYGVPSYSASNSGWLELNQEMMEVPTLVALVLHLRLLQLAFSGRRRSVVAGQSKPVMTSSERTVLKVCLPLYLLGAVVATTVHAVFNVRAAASEMNLPAALWWEELVSYAGLVLDGFLLPQIILNASSSGGGCSGAARAISPWFYVGGTVIRMVPHAYDLVRRQVYVPSISPSGLYASARDELFGVAWDVVVPCGAALLASILFWQQRLRAGGGRAPLFGAS